MSWLFFGFPIFFTSPNPPKSFPCRLSLCFDPSNGLQGWIYDPSPIHRSKNFKAGGTRSPAFYKGFTIGDLTLAEICLGDGSYKSCVHNCGSDHFSRLHVCESHSLARTSMDLQGFLFDFPICSCKFFRGQTTPWYLNSPFAYQFSGKFQGKINENLKKTRKIQGKTSKFQEKPGKVYY